LSVAANHPPKCAKELIHGTRATGSYKGTLLLKKKYVHWFLLSLLLPILRMVVVSQKGAGSSIRRYGFKIINKEGERK
jgi:hypothetical protein